MAQVYLFKHTTTVRGREREGTMRGEGTVTGNYEGTMREGTMRDEGTVTMRAL